MNAPWPLIGMAAVLGLVIGSFLNVVIYRVPRQLSISRPGSHCPGCQSPIKPWHNVPVLSWLALRGKCAWCHERISARYPLVEAGTAALFAGITAKFGLSVQLPAYLYLAAIAITLAMIGADARRLPDSIILPSYIVSALLLMPAGASHIDWQSGIRALGGMLALIALFFVLALAYPNGLGFGDVKLAGLVGIYLGWLSWSALFLTAVGSFVLAAAGGSAAVATRHATRNMAVPIGPCLIGAAVLALFFAAPISSWYGSLVTV
jgi:leader peptidase (prepilin peptidase)/N-methyltransferase